MQVFGLTLMFLCGSVQAAAKPTASGCQEKVSAFLTHPGKRALAALSESGSASCWQVIGSSNANLNQLNHRVERGSRWAAQYLAEHLSQLDGGNLEDSLIAIGQFSDHDMHQFLVFAKEGLLSKHELSDALTMLPLSMSDDAHGQLKLLDERRERVAHVSQKGLAEQRSEALKAIDDFASEIKSKTPVSLR